MYLFSFTGVGQSGGAELRSSGGEGGGALAVTGTCVQALQSALGELMASTFATDFQREAEQKSRTENN